MSTDFSTPYQRRGGPGFPWEPMTETEMRADVRVMGGSIDAANERRGYEAIRVTPVVPEPGTDLIRAAAQGIGARYYTQGLEGTVGCACGAVSQSLTEYIFDERGRMDERVLWALVEVLEHVIDRGPSHTLAVLVGE
jgi:hypothetical protein